MRFAALDTLPALLRLAEFALRSWLGFVLLILTMIDDLFVLPQRIDAALSPGN